MRAGFNAFKKNGGDPKRLIEKFNFLTVGHSSDAVKVSETFDRKKYFASLTYPDGPSTILAIEGGHLTYSDAWHSVYRAFAPNEKGQMDSTFQYESDDRTKLSIIKEMSWVIQAVMTPEFDQMVRKTAKSFGVEIPPLRTSARECADVLKQKMKR